MLETSNPEINVNELMERVRAEAAKIRRASISGATVPANGSFVRLSEPPRLRPPPSLPELRTLKFKRNELLERLGIARTHNEGNRLVPKFLRRLFRKQGRYNVILLDIVSSVVKSNGELNNRLRELHTAFAEQGHWLQAMFDRSVGDSGWMRDAARAFDSLCADVAEKAEQIDSLRQQFEQAAAAAEKREVERLASFRRQHDALATEVAQLRSDLAAANEHLRNLQAQTESLPAVISDLHRDVDTAGEHVRNLQGQFDRAAEHLRKFNGDTEPRVHAMQETLDRAGEHLRNLQNQVDPTAAHVQNLQAQFDRAGVHLQHLQHDTERNAADTRALSDRVGGAMLDRAALEQTLSRVDERQTNDAAFIKGELSLHRTLFARSAKSRIASADRRAVPQDTVDPHRLDALYLSFENRFRGTRAEVKQRLMVYLPYVDASKAGTKDRPIVDLGCGRGEWLELLSERQADARGVDLNRSMISFCAERQLDVTEKDAVEYLRSLPDGSLGAVTGFHIIEHLSLDQLVDVLDETLRVLKPGGLVIFESPNCKNLIVGACNFNIDPTHRNPIFPETAEFMLKEQGFEVAEIKYLSPVEPHANASDTGSAVVNDLLYGAQDFGVIAHKRAS